MRYEKSFKQEALKLSDEIGIKNAAQQLGIPYYTLADWRHRQNVFGEEAFIGSRYEQMSTDEKERRIQELEQKNAEPERANEILKDALVFLAKDR